MSIISQAISAGGDAWSKVIGARNSTVAQTPGMTNYGNPFDALPPAAREKYDSIVFAADDAGAAASAFHERIEETRQNLLQHIGRLRHLQSDGYKGDAYDVAVARENEVIAKLTAERDALQAKQKARNAAAAPLRLLRDNLSRYVENRLAGFEVIEAPLMPPPSLKKGETVGDAVERVRQEIGRLHDDVAAARAAPWPSSAAKAKVRQQISALVERGRPNLLVLLEGHRREFQFATRLAPPVLVRGFQESGAGVTEAGEQFDSEATLAWLFEEALIQKLDKEIERVSDDASALSDEQRAAKIAELAAKTLAAERLEEALIMQGEAMGQPIQRHAAADARAVLSLSDSMPPPQRAA